MTNTNTKTATTTFANPQFLVSDMQHYNTFRISHIKPADIKFADNDTSSILATSVNLDENGFLKFERDFTYSYSTGIKSATKIINEGMATYRIDKPDGWNHYGVMDSNSKWLTDDYITVKAWNEEQNTKPCTIEKFDMYSLVNPIYFDEKPSNRNCIIIDINKLGVMTDRQKYDFKKYMSDISKYGYSDYKTPCYIIETDNDLFSEGLYTLDREKILEKGNWDRADDCVKILRGYGER
jgi:hypothetical protein